LTSGIGAITAASGDEVNLVISGLFCAETLAPPLVVHASFEVLCPSGAFYLPPLRAMVG
jgi:hypothetical protein